MAYSEIPHPRRGGLLRPLGWSLAVHVLLLLLFSAGAGRVFRTPPVGVLMNWAVLSEPQTVLMLQPRGEPPRVNVRAAALARSFDGSPGPDHAKAVTARLRDLRVPMEPQRPPRSPRPSLPLAAEGWLWEAGRTSPSPVDAVALTSPVFERPLPIPPAGAPGDGGTLEVATLDWRDRTIAWPPGKPAREVGVEGPPALVERALVDSVDPGDRKGGPPAVYRFAVDADGRVAGIVPLSVPEPDWYRATYEALLSWRFAPLPSWVGEQEFWGRVIFE